MTSVIALSLWRLCKGDTLSGSSHQMVGVNNLVFVHFLITCKISITTLNIATNKLNGCLSDILWLVLLLLNLIRFSAAVVHVNL